MSNDRKESFKKSTRKRKEKLKDLGYVSLNTFVTQSAKEKLINIQEEKGYTMVGDVISEIMKKYDFTRVK